MDLLSKLKFIFSRTQKIRFLVILIITFGGAVAETFGVTMIIPLISVITNLDYIFSQPILSYIYKWFNIQTVNHFIIILLLALMAVYITKTIYLFVMYKLQYRFIFNNQMLLSKRLMTFYLNRNYEYHLNNNSAEMIQRITQNISQLFQLILNVIQLTAEVMVILCISIVLIIIDPVVAIIIIVAITIIMTLFVVSYKKLLTQAGISYQENNKEMIKWINQSVGGIKEIKVVQREQFFIDAFSKSAVKYAESQRKYYFLTQSPRILIEAICISTVLLILSVMLYGGKDISVMIPQLTAFAVAAFRIMPSFNRIATYYNTIIYYRPSIDLIYKEIKETDTEKKSARYYSNNLDTQILKVDNSIKMSNLCFKYMNTDNYILDNAVFEIPLKKSIAIIGTSGAGKTTFVDVFLGLLEPTSGEITINGINVHNKKGEWLENLGYIPQNIYLCDDTIRRNIAFGINEFEIDEERVNMSLEKAQLHEFVKTLPNGINTEIGERGIRLSGGQRQRIGIARAFYRNPEIYVLDEATSALDSDTEAAVMEAIDAIKGEKTLVIIAHRLSTIKNCDIVLKIEDGKVLKTNFEDKTGE